MFQITLCSYETDCCQATAIPGCQPPFSKSRKKVEIREDGSIRASNQEMMGVGSSFGKMMQWDEKKEP
jgi:hypothetical protein